MVCQGWNSLWLCAHFLWLRAHSHDCVHILPRGPSSPSLSSSSSSLSSPLPACNNRGWFKFKFQPVTIYVRIRTQSEHSQQQSNIKCHNQTQRQEYIPQLKLWRHKEGFDQNIKIRSTLVTSSSPRAAAASRRLLSARLRKTKCFVGHQVLLDDHCSLVVTWCASKAPRASGHQVGQAHCFSGSPCPEGSWKILVEEDRSAEQSKAF